MTAKKIIIKSISALLIISTILPAVLLSSPQQVTAQGFVPVNDALANKLQTAILKATGGSLALENKSWIEYLGEQVLKMVAKRILAAMTQATVNWINSGFHGSPLFVENPESFFRDIRKSVVRSIVDMIGYDDIRFPFGKQTALNVIASYKSQLETNAQYTLSKVINDPDLLREYRSNFNYGGWNGFLINTQYPQNNYLGFNMIIGESLGSQLSGTLQAPAEKVRDALQQGLGFLSPQTCADNGGNNEYNKKIGNQFVRPSFKPTTGPANESEEDYHARIETERSTWAAENTCQNLVSTTPGYVAATQIANSLDSPRMMTLLDGALGNSFAAIFDALINKLLGDGLTALASTVNSAPEEDNWSYAGQTLDSGTNITASSAGALNINSPQHSVSLNTGATAPAKTVSGGTAPYRFSNGSQIVLFNIPGTTTRIAEARITNAGVLTIQGGSASGEASVVIQDSSDPAKGTTINIEVNNPAEVVTSPRAFTEAFSINTNDTASAKILGGNKPYSIETKPDQSIAIAGIADNILIVSGIATGTTSVRIKDSSGKNHEVLITIKDSGAQLITQEQSERIILYTSGNGTTADRNISFTNGRITSTNPNVAIAAYVANSPTPTLKFSHIGKGDTRITVENLNNTSQDSQVVEFNVTVVDKLIPSKIKYYGGNDVTVDSAGRAILTFGGYYEIRISGGVQPYGAGTYSNARDVRFIQGNNSRLFFIANGTRGSEGYINISDSSGQPAVRVYFVMN